MDKKSDKTGYGNPPKESQFKPGQSGNPSGRPLGSKNLRTLFFEAVNKSITTKENGEEVVMTGLELMVKNSCEKAMKGDINSIRFIDRMIQQLEMSQNNMHPHMIKRQLL